MIIIKIVGIVTRKSISLEKHNINIIYNDIIKSLYNKNILTIGITLNSDYKSILDICDGVIFQGGDIEEEYDLLGLKYLYDIDKPTLGICLGMQEMGKLFNGSIIDIDNHKSKEKYVHSINIENNSKLYKIFNTNILKVNSRHKSVLNNTDLYVSAISNDGYIEAIEDINKKFFIGVQWHPESMVNYDYIQNKLFDNFVNSL